MYFIWFCGFIGQLSARIHSFSFRFYFAEYSDCLKFLENLSWRKRSIRKCCWILLLGMLKTKIRE